MTRWIRLWRVLVTFFFHVFYMNGIRGTFFINDDGVLGVLEGGQGDGVRG